MPYLRWIFVLSGVAMAIVIALVVVYLAWTGASGWLNKIMRRRAKPTLE